MSKLEKLDLMGVASLAVVTGALLVGWMVTSYHSAAPETRHAAQEQRNVTLTDDGRMRLIVTAGRDETAAPTAAPRRTASSRPTSSPSLEVALPFVFRP